MRIHLILLIVASVLIICSSTHAQTICVGTAATGNGSGNDWNNIKAWSTVVPIRGATYYLSNTNGTYSFGALSTQDDGQLITLKGATNAEHGPADGWQSALSVNSLDGGSQAKISRFSITTSNWKIDGAVGAGASPNYGFGIHDASSHGTDFIDLTAGRTGITLSHLELDGIDCCNIDPVTDGGARGIVVPSGGQIGEATFDHLYIHDFKSAPLLLGGKATLQYSYFARTRVTADQHAEAWSYRGGNGAIIRFNTFLDVGGTGQFVALYNTATNVEIYGNAFIDDGLCAGCGGTAFPATDNFEPGNPNYNGAIVGLKFYNNTIFGFRGNAGVHQSAGSSNYDIRNNFWYGCAYGLTLEGSHDYNIIWDCDWRFATPAAHESWICGSNANCSARDAKYRGSPPAAALIFNASPLNLTLKGESVSGISLLGAPLASPYNIDLLGTQRGSGTGWDIGAYEYSTGVQTTSPRPPTNLRIN